MHEKGKTSNSEWFGVEHYPILHEMDLFRHVNMERLKMLYPDIFGKSQTETSQEKTAQLND
ncbi:hypothetical protein B5F93_06770 [Odoribacter splanchnicus]|nr:hypothetical protein B5F99_03495 [Odoribacter splanchnicus]OUO14813.1 hypothetical protein B5F93_06770 [Odoribacter splanchnicus]